MATLLLAKGICHLTTVIINYIDIHIWPIRSPYIHQKKNRRITVPSSLYKFKVYAILLLFKILYGSTHIFLNIFNTTKKISFSPSKKEMFIHFLFNCVLPLAPVFLIQLTQPISIWPKSYMFQPYNWTQWYLCERVFSFMFFFHSSLCNKQLFGVQLTLGCI